MQITLDIDDDLLVIAEQMAEQQHKTVGQIVSALMRQALSRPNDETQPDH